MESVIRVTILENHLNYRDKIIKILVFLENGKSLYRNETRKIFSETIISLSMDYYWKTLMSALNSIKVFIFSVVIE